MNVMNEWMNVFYGNLISAMDESMDDESKHACAFIAMVALHISPLNGVPLKLVSFSGSAQSTVYLSGFWIYIIEHNVSNYGKFFECSVVSVHS